VLSSCGCDDFCNVCVNNDGIREELVQWFEKFVMMAINPGADLESLPILDNPLAHNLILHAYAAFIFKLSDVAMYNLMQLISSKSYSTCSITKPCLFISCMPFFGSTIYLVSQIASLAGVDISYALVC